MSIIHYDAAMGTLFVSALSDVSLPFASTVPAAAYPCGTKAYVRSPGSVGDGSVFVSMLDSLGRLLWEPYRGPVELITREMYAGLVAFRAGESEPESSTTMLTFQTKATLSLPALPVGGYLISAWSEMTGSSVSRAIEAQLSVDGVVISSLLWKPSVADAFAPVPMDSHRSFSSVGDHTLLLSYRSGQSGQTAKIRRARITVWRTT